MVTTADGEQALESSLQRKPCSYDPGYYAAKDERFRGVPHPA
jgi:hypothetical protein